jgi:hypothetical protein
MRINEDDEPVGIAPSPLRIEHCFGISKVRRIRENLPDVIFQILAQERFPVACFPKPESLHIRIVITHGSIAIRSALEVKIDQFLQVRSHDLIRINEYHTL